MSLLDTIKKDQFEARKNKDAVKASLLAALFSEASMIGKNAGNRETTDDETIKVIQKFLKDVQETLDALKLSSDARVAVAQAEKAILEAYLPKRASETEVLAEIATLKAGGLRSGQAVTRHSRNFSLIVASGAGLVLPLLAAYLSTQLLFDLPLLQTNSTLSTLAYSWLGRPLVDGFLMLFLTGLILHGVAKCAPLYPMLSLLGLSAATNFPAGTSLVLLVTAAAGVAGLVLAHALYTRLRPPQTEGECAVDTLNPRCKTCHARAFCPYQPSGIADRYTPDTKE